MYLFIISLLVFISCSSYWRTIPQLFVEYKPKISFTFDDGTTRDIAGYRFEDRKKTILETFEDAEVKAFFFVTGFNKIYQKGQASLQSWSDKAHQIANYTYSHLNLYNKNITYAQFVEKFLKTDSLISYIDLFRFPYLKEGNPTQKVDYFRVLRKKNECRDGHLTIDDSDWYIESRLRKKLEQGSEADLESFQQNHFYDRIVCCEQLAYPVIGRNIIRRLLYCTTSCMLHCSSMTSYSFLRKRLGGS